MIEISDHWVNAGLLCVSYGDTRVLHYNEPFLCPVNYDGMLSSCTC